MGMAPCVEAGVANNLFTNPGFENADDAFTGWAKFPADWGNMATMATGSGFYESEDTFTALEGTNGYKIWPAYSGADNEVNVYQQFDNTEVKTYQLNVSVYHASQEPFTGATDKAFFKFFAADFSANTIGMRQRLNSATAADGWTVLSA